MKTIKGIITTVNENNPDAQNNTARTAVANEDPRIAILVSSCFHTINNTRKNVNRIKLMNNPLDNWFTATNISRILSASVTFVKLYTTILNSPF